MWTKLLWMEFPKVIQPQKFGKRVVQSTLSNRYKAKLRKEFRIANIPWVFEKHNPIGVNNPRNRRPKGNKVERSRPVRLAKIEKNLEMADQAELEYRLKRLNNKKMTGIDLMIQRAMPSFMTLRANKSSQDQTGQGLVKLDKGKAAFSTKKK